MKVDCDIILLSYESPGLLKRCVESILSSTRVKARLIIVDNASRDEEVIRYLQGVHGSSNVVIEKVFSEENVGFSAGINKGLRLSEAPYVCILNNDCEVTEGWLGEMIMVSKTSGRIGLVNPQSNTFGSRPEEGRSLQEHSLSLKGKKGRYIEMGHAIGFACLIKKEVIDRVGYLDEDYEGFCYEDTDYSLRASKAGCIPVLAEAAYVFHEEQASRSKVKEKEAVYTRNRKLFEKRWGKLLRIFILEVPKTKIQDFSSYYDILKGLARERAIVELWGRGDSLTKHFADELDKGEIIKHADVSIKFHSGKFIIPFVLWKVFTKKKKYDAVITDNEFLFHVLRATKFFHKSVAFLVDPRTGFVSNKAKVFDLKKSDAFAEYLRKAK